MPRRPPGSVDVALPGPPAQPVRRRRAPPRPSTSTSRPASRAQLLADHVGLERALPRRASTCWKSQPPQRPGPGVRARRGRPGPASGSSTSTASARQNRSPVGALGDLDDDPLAGQRVPHEDHPARAVGRRAAGRRSGRRARPGRPRRRTAPRRATGRAARAGAGSAPRRLSAAPSRPLPRRSTCAAAQVAGADPDVLAQLALAGDLGGAQLVGHRGDHHAGREQQPALEPQRGLVVQQLLPPAADDVLRDVDRDDAARVGLLDLGGVLDDRPDQLAVRRVQHLERHADVALVPLLQQPVGLRGVGRDVDALEHVGPGRLGERERPQRRLVQLGDQHDRVHPGGQDLVVLVGRELQPPRCRSAAGSRA